MTAPNETAVPFDASAFIENSQDIAALRAKDSVEYCSTVPMATLRLFLPPSERFSRYRRTHTSGPFFLAFKQTQPN
jgi:hypothetical protein